MEDNRRNGGGALLLPACGEKVGMRGCAISKQAPHPALRADLSPQAGRGRRAAPGEGLLPNSKAPHPTLLPASGEKERTVFGANVRFKPSNRQLFGSALASCTGFFAAGLAAFLDVFAEASCTGFAGCFASTVTRTLPTPRLPRPSA